MGNVCPWCFKARDIVASRAGNLADDSGLSSSEVNDRTPLLSKTITHQPVTSTFHESQSNGEPASSLSNIALPLPPALTNVAHLESTTVSSNETAETKMAYIVDGMLSKLIDVGSNHSGLHANNANANGLHAQNDHLRNVLNKSLLSTQLTPLPDVGLTNLPSLLSDRPTSSEICHYVAHTAGELSRLLIDEIKIVHKEDLVAIFE